MSLPYTPVVPQAELHQTQAALAASHAAHQELLGAHHEVTTQQKSAMANHSSTRDELLYRISALERQVWTPLIFWAVSRGIQCRTGWVICCLLALTAMQRRWRRAAAAKLLSLRHAYACAD